MFLVMMLLPVMIFTGPSIAPWGVLKQSTVGCDAAKKGVVQLCGVWLGQVCVWYS